MRIEEIEKYLREFEKKLIITPVTLSPEQLAERKAVKLKMEQAKQKEYKKIERLKGKKILEGVAASPGLAVGTVRNVYEQVPELLAQIKTGDVIVAQRLTVKDDAVISKAAAFIINTGSPTASITAKAREKPAVTDTLGKGEEATQILKTGQRVVVDGTEGTVYECVKT